MFNTLFSTNARKNLKSFTRRCVSLLEICTNERLIRHGNALHCQLLKLGLSSHRYIAVKLLIMYLDSRKSNEINQMLREFHGFNLVAHNCLISANLNWGDVDRARRLFDEMPERNAVSWTSLISGLLKFGKVEEAMDYFERNPFSDVFSWTAAISGLVCNRLGFRGMAMFRDMIRAGILPNGISFTSVVKGCVELGDLGLGMSVLGVIVKLGFEGNVCVLNSLVTFFLKLGEIDSARKVFGMMEVKDVVSWTTMLDVYVEMGDMGGARRVFDEMPERNEVTWSAMIARLGQGGEAEEAVRVFVEMVRCGFKPNVSCYSSVISALAGLKGLESGRSVHGVVVKSGVDGNVFVGCSLIDLYCKCGSCGDGRFVFDALPHKNVVCWNAMVAGYSSNGMISEAVEVFNRMPERNVVSWNSLIAGYLGVEDFDEAFEVFHRMILCGVQPSKSSFSSVLRACASLASLERGEYAHAKALKLGFQRDIFVDTALLDMYAKSGEIASAVRIFDRMKNKNDVAWTAMIQGLAENGFAEESLQRFEEMGNDASSSVAAPNELIFLSVLFACSHCGLVEKGLAHFDSMERVYGIRPNQRHYTCVVDMLSRAGRLREAEEFMAGMPCEPEANAWSALLSGCRTYGDEELGSRVSRKLAGLAEAKPGAYVLLSNSYASGGRWVDAMNARDAMSRKGIKKSGGCSWMELRNRVHMFYSQDESHEQWREIKWILQLLNSERESCL